MAVVLYMLYISPSLDTHFTLYHGGDIDFRSALFVFLPLISEQLSDGRSASDPEFP